MPIPAPKKDTDTLQNLLQRLLTQDGGIPPIALQLVQPAYTDEAGAAKYVGLTRTTFRGHVKRGVFKRGVRLTPNGKLIYKLSDLDYAIVKGGMSRKPKPPLRGIVKQRLDQQQHKRSRQRQA
jgi:hypothetical protein